MPSRTRDERLFGAACLKLTLEKTLGANAGAAEIYRATLQDLELSDIDVDVYLDAHRADVVAALKSKGRHVG